MTHLNDDIQINRGFEFLLRKQKTKRRRPIHIIFKKVGSFFKREVNLYFEFSLSVKKSELNKSNTLKEVRK
jgi:hypothetical protein|tara:strand:- start:789 stop:1001 length:213 start_codon:yes stop_codon:yes gene_type:complete